MIPISLPFKFWTGLCTCLLWGLAPAHLTADDLTYTLTYTLRFPQAANHYVDVELEFDCDGDDGESIEVMMPTWTPGSYLVREYARFVQDVVATGTRDRELEVSKTRKNRWAIARQGSRRVKLQYRVYCHELSVRTNWVDADQAVLNGAATFLVPVHRLADPIRIQVELPSQWPRSVCALPADPQTAHVYRADNFDQVVDSPILCGDCQIFPFQVGGKNHYLVNLGEDELWDGQRAANDLKKLVQEHHRFWGEVPYEEYYFLNVILGGGGGLEHDNCTLLMASRRGMASPAAYRRWLSLCSHEFFHTWNVRRLRPRGLVEYDYENEVYVRELWVAEGATSYYQNLLLVRAGLMRSTEFLDRLSGDIASAENRPGNLVQSLADSSFDAWIDFYRPHENSANTSVSYYGRGAVAAFVLDGEIRRASEGQRSLDDVLRVLYQRYRQDGYTNREVEQVSSEMAGVELEDWFRRFIEQPEAFEYDATLETLGLSWAPPTRQESEREEAVTIGLSVRDSDGRTRVSAIRADSAAFRAGLNLNDEVIALGQQRVNADSFASELRQYSPGDVVSLLLARRNQLRTVNVVVDSDPRPSWRLARQRRPSQQQSAQWDAWLSGDQPAPAEPDQQEAGQADTEEVDTEEVDTEKSVQQEDANDRATEERETGVLPRVELDTDVAMSRVGWR